MFLAFFLKRYLISLENVRVLVKLIHELFCFFNHGIKNVAIRLGPKNGFGIVENGFELEFPIEMGSVSKCHKILKRFF